MSVIVDAREKAGLSQAELARRCGLTRSNLSAIEAGRRGASPAMVARILDATGRPSAVLRAHRQEVLEAVAAHGGSNPRVFGSVARGEDLPGSDVDLLVCAEPGRGWDLVNLPSVLERMLGLPVDVITDGALHGRLALEVQREAVPL